MKFKYSRAHKPSAPIIKVTLLTKSGEHEIELIVHTGFSGGILIPFSLYLKLGFTLFEVPSKYYGVLPIGIQIPLHTALARIMIGDIVLKVHIHSHPLLNKQLAGREVLNKMKILLNGPAEELEIIK